MDERQQTQWYTDDECPKCGETGCIVTNGRYRWCTVAHCGWTDYDNTDNGGNND